MKTPAQGKAFFIAVFFSLLAVSSTASGGERIGLLPLVNLSDAGKLEFFGISSHMLTTLQQKGYEVISGEPIEEVLEKGRVRYLDSLPPSVLKELTENLGLDGVVAGTVLSLFTGENPQVALSVRLISRTGETTGSRTVSITGADSETILGLGRIKTINDLVPVAVNRVLEAFGPGSGDAGSAGRATDVPPGPASPVFPMLDQGSVQRIAVLPVENLTDQKRAGRILTELLTQQLRQTGSFVVVEQEELRRVRIEEDIFPLPQLNIEQLRRLGVKLAARYVMKGTLYKYRESRMTGGKETPEVDLFLSLIDTQGGTIVWSARSERRGDYYRSVLDFGVIKNTISLADRSLKELLRNLPKGDRKQ